MRVVLQYATSGHTACKCGHVLPRASDEEKQVLKKVMKRFSGLTTSAFGGKSRGETIGILGLPVAS